MTKIVQVPYGRFQFMTPDQTYELDKILETFDAPDELTFAVQGYVEESWIISLHVGVHWNTARVAVLQAMMASDIPVMVSVFGGTVIDVQEPDIDSAFECDECGYNMCEHGNCGCGDTDCGCWSEGEFIA